MMTKMKELVVLALLVCAGCASDCISPSPPQWSNAYSVRGILSIPYAELTEPFMAYFDGSIGSSRIDYYGDMVKTYQLSTMGPYGSMIKVAPVTTEAQTNVMSCLQVNGTKDSKVGPQSVLPDLSHFKCAGSDVIDGIETEKWVRSDQVEEKISKYTMWLSWKKTSSGQSAPVPHRYEMKGYNSLLGSHYDHYYLSYDLFDSSPPAAAVWQIEKSLTCGSFPGPGVRAVASFNPMKEFVHNYDSHIEHAWKEFKVKHNKQYRSKEHERRRMIFRDNHRLIHSHNRKGLSYQLRLNRFADWDQDELKLLRGKIYSGVSNNASAFPYSEKIVSSSKNAVPDTFDWRLYGGVTPVKDQSVCGSCWSFGTTGTIEGAYFVKTGLLISLSEQALVDCSWGYGNNGCDGGEDWRAYQWMMKHGGLPLEGDYGNYLGSDGYCHIDQVKLVAPITGYVNVTPYDEQALRLAIFKKGPISIGIDASKKTFTFYSHGVYSDPQCSSKVEDQDHAVLAVGYGTMNGQNYWLVKNSWSNMWGNDGYILIAAKHNICGVMTSPTYVTM